MFDRVTRQLLIVGAITAAIIAGYSALLYYSAIKADRVQDNRTGVLLRTKAFDHGERVAVALEKLALSDVVFDALERGDPRMLEAICGREDVAGQFSSFGLISPDGEPILLCEDGKAKSVVEHGYVFGLPAAAAAGRYGQMLAMRKANGIALPEFVYTQTFTELASRPYTLLTALVAPERITPVETGHRPAVAFALSNLRVALQKLQDQLAIDGLEFHMVPIDERDAFVSLEDKEGTSALMLAWRPSHSFRDQLLASMPLVIALALALFQIVVSSLRRIGLLQQAIVEREAATLQMALHDGLTGLPNRMNFMEKAAEAVNRSTADAPVFLGMFDLDRFKAVNDTYGHDVGDRLIVETARRAASVLPPGDVVARLGGDEFAMMIRSVASDRDAIALMDRLQQAIRQDFDCGAGRITPSASIGLACAPRDGTTLENILKAADIALYEVKTGGRGFARTYEPAHRLRQVSAGGHRG